MQHNTLVSILTEKSSGDAGITFIKRSSQEGFLSYSDLYNAAVKGLSFLQYKGMRPKDELVFQVEDNRSFVITFWACLLGGIIPVPLSIGKNDDHKQKLFNVWSVLNHPFLVIAKENLAALDAFVKLQGLESDYSLMMNRLVEEEGVLSADSKGAIFHAQEDDIAFIQFSSGSTGSPKGVVLTHKNLITNIGDISKAAAYSQHDSTISWMPLTHDMGLIGFHLNPLFMGMNQYLIATPDFVRNPALWMDKTSKHKITILCSPNFGYKFLLRHCENELEYDWDLSQVRILYNGAEPISATLSQEFLNVFSKYGLKHTSICPVYGLAEASLAVSISGLDDEMISVELDRNALNFGDRIMPTEDDAHAVSFVNVGTAIEHCAIRIVDDKNKLVGDEIIGHIQIKGPNVTKGYYNNEAETRKVITPDGWLATGDLGFMKKKALYITGRAKDIIFVNGQNYYPHDIERVAEAVEGIELNKIAVAGFFNTQSQKEETIAFVLHRGTPESFVPVSKSLKAYVNAAVGFEIDRVIPVSNIPRTTSGKLQRFKLLEQFNNGEFNEVEAALCRLLEEAAQQNILTQDLDEYESKLLRIWTAILKGAPVDANRSFFEQGGNSLKAAEMSMAIARDFKVELPVEVLYEKQTIRELAIAIKQSNNYAYAPIPCAQKADHYPVSPSQEQLYYTWKLDTGSIAYNIPLAFRITGDVDADRLERCIQQLIHRYDSLRMSLHMNDAPVMKVHGNINFKLDCSACDSNALNETLKSLVQSFDLAAAPLFRICLLKLSDGGHVLFTDFHHIISDGVSVYNFVADLLVVYSGKELTDLPVQYADYACWAKENSPEKITLQEEYWTGQLNGELPLLELPADYKRPVLFNTHGKKLEFTLDSKTTANLKDLAESSNATLHALLFTVYNILLSKYSGQDDMIVGIPVSGRRHPDLQGMFGMFVNNLAIRTEIDGNDSFLQLVEKESKHLASALNNQDYPFGGLVNKLAGKRDVGRNPIFDTMFVYQNMGFPQADNTGFTIERHFFDPGFSKFDLSLEVFEDAASLKYYIEFCTSLFSQQTIMRLQRHFDNLIQASITNPNERIADVSLLDSTEFSEYIDSFNDTGDVYPKHKTIHQLFSEQVERTPDAIALEYGQNTLTYRELNDKADSVAVSLQAKGVTKDVIVAVLLERSPELVIALLGILKAGGAYLPIDIDLPAERVASLINTSQCRIVISKEEHIEAISQLSDITCVDVNKLPAAAVGIGHKGDPTDLAYVLYTSGTTGLPKGVMIAHQSVVNYIRWAAKSYITKGGAFPLFTSISFDLTVTSIFTPLLTGNRIVIYAENGTELLIERIISENKVDIIKLTPSHLKLLAETVSERPAHEYRARTFIAGGENLDTAVAKKMYDKFGGNLEIYNEYGPTEATVGCMIYKVNPDENFPNVPIGVPAANTQIYVLDKYLKPVPTGVAGELYIAGDGLARGYLFNEALTNQQFIPNPFVGGKLMYKTGDMAKRMPGGAIVFIGRADQQVKINGYRIELAEIENHLATHPAISEAVVAVKNNKLQQPNLCAYYKRNGESDAVDSAALRTYLAKRLPHYMLPVHFVMIDEIPLNKNGKRDYAALPDPVATKEATDITLPQNRIQELCLEIWKQVLGETRLGITDNFFELGGDSIKAIQITSRLFEQGIALNVKDILTYHTIEQISVHAKMASTEASEAQETPEGRKGKTPIEAWFFGQHFENPHYYNQSILLGLNKKINLQLLQAAFEKLVEHHDGLRLNYDPATQSMFYNNRHLEDRFTIDEYAISDADELPEVCSDIKSSLNITRGLLIKAAIIKNGTGNEMLFITAHHLIIDGVSWRILLEDLHAAYTALENEQSIKLSRKTASLAQWQQALFQNPGLDAPENETNYWRLAESTAFSISTDADVNDWSMQHARNISGSLDEQQTLFLLREAHRTYNTDVPILLNTALALTLRDLTGLDEVVIEQENHGRHLPGINASRTLGWFTAMYPLKLAVVDHSIGEQIMSVKEQMRTLPNNGMGYGIYKTMGLLNNGWDASLTPVRFNYLGQFDNEVNNGLFSFLQKDTGSDIGLSNQMTCMLEINCMIIGGKFVLTLTYNHLAHSTETITLFRDKYFIHLHSILNFLEKAEDIHFTPSDFDAAALSSEDLKQLFG